MVEGINLITVVYSEFSFKEAPVSFDESSLHLPPSVSHTILGWSVDCLQEWGAFIRLAFPSMLMLCVEWWTYEIGGFLAGLQTYFALR